jgi:hypothetical protein
MVGAVCAAALLAAPAALRAQQAPSMEPGSQLRVYLLTMGPGDAIWEKFGHNALWIRDERTGSDVAYNWGMFDFAADDFIPRFLQGSMRYWMEAFPLVPMVNAYASANRSVWAQELALTAEEKQALNEFVQWNALEENKYYTYDYYRDNCSTRVRDALDRVLGGRLLAETDTIPTGTTWRWHTRRLTEDAQPIYTGIDVMLGQPVDRPISAWEEMFLPMRLRDRARDLRVVGPGGVEQPFVVGEMQLFAATREPEPARPANLLPVYLALGAALALLLVAFAATAERGRRAARLGFVVVGTTWSIVAGIGGTLMLLTWLFTDHVVAHANENLLQLSPLSLVLAVLLPMTLLRERGRKGPEPAVAPVESRRADLGTATRLAIAVAGLSAIGFVFQLLPMFDQVNGQTIALALPPHLALAWGVWTLTARWRAASTPNASARPFPGRRAPESAASVPGGAGR